MAEHAVSAIPTAHFTSNHRMLVCQAAARGHRRVTRQQCRYRSTYLRRRRLFQLEALALHDLLLARVAGIAGVMLVEMAKVFSMRPSHRTAMYKYLFLLNYFLASRLTCINPCDHRSRDSDIVCACARKHESGSTGPGGQGDASMSDSNIAMATIKAEHRSLRAVLQTFQESLAKTVEGYASAEFGLYSAMLYYIDDFQERCHHPKEDEYLFKALSAATSEFDDIISELQAGHVSGVHAIAGLHRRLVHYQGGAADGLGALKAGIDTYAARMLEHMRIEEELLERSLTVINEQGWAKIAAAFDKNDDPLFGNNRRDEFTQLYQRIQLLAPRRLKHGLLQASRT